MKQPDDLPPTPTAPPHAGTDVSDDHGRPLTTNATAAAWYRVAQRSLVHRAGRPGPSTGAGGRPHLRRRRLRPACRRHVRDAHLRAGTAVDDVGAPPLRDRRRGPAGHRTRVRHLARTPRRRRLRPVAVHIVCSAIRSATCHDHMRCADIADLVASMPDCHPPTDRVERRRLRDQPLIHPDSATRWLGVGTPWTPQTS